MSEILGGLTLLREASALSTWRASLGTTASLGFVATMGSLHEGHGSLIRASLQQCDATMVSIFVNPLQFNDPADLAAYPRDEDADLALLAEWGVTAAYLPSTAAMAPAGAHDLESAGDVGSLWEGEFRPGHFDGMLTVVRRLFRDVQPSDAWFGQKDAQQLFLVRQMAARLGSPNIVAGATLRASDGLALSTRNQRLSAPDRARALTLQQGLQQANLAYCQGSRDAVALKQLIRTPMENAGLQVDYAALVLDSTFSPVQDSDQSGSWRAIVAAQVGAVRLLDNLLLGEQA